MNPKPVSETEALRSDIEMTRRRMDDTMNALGERMQGRHILDEVIGFFRHNSERTAETGSRVRQKLSETAGRISDSASTAANAVTDTVKKNPLPILLITAGAAWLAYSATRNRTADPEDEDLEDSDRYDPDTHYDRPLQYPGGSASAGVEEGLESEGGSKPGELEDTVQEKASTAKEEVRQKLSDLGDRTREKLGSMKERASEIGSQVRDRTRELYSRSRDVVARTADEHPVELGLGCLAVGVLVGLALPTPSPVNRLAGPTVDRLRTRTREAGREMLQKGKRVVQAATDAARHEAESQGLTPGHLMNAVGATAAAKDAMAEDVDADSARAVDQPADRDPAPPADPSAARSGM